ncbi:hypothetical protein F2P56_013565 [Juglans regia]|uniref:Retrotransposon Copia-like N-terminal domain-containing protein n=1 Tax=Juglans regia TaxID=51240 RepID=A0A833XRU0_JUGRE|nr:hypothetical protein F2P56_013565 [Juglans regia]
MEILSYIQLEGTPIKEWPSSIGYLTPALNLLSLYLEQCVHQLQNQKELCLSDYSIMLKEDERYSSINGCFTGIEHLSIEGSKDLEHIQDHSCGITFPGNKIPDWFSHTKETSNGDHSCELDIHGPLYLESSNNSSQNSSPPLGNPSDDSSSYYYLHPSDNPRALLVSEIFSGDNYVAWSWSITIALIVKNKVSFIDGILPKPSSTNSRLKTTWLRANNLVLSWLMNFIEKEIRGSLLYFNSAADIWNELKIRYLRSDGPRVFALEKSLSSISQVSNSVTEYFSAFKALWDEYISYCPLPTCNCGFLEKCTCAVLKNLADQQQADYIMKFLIGLHDSFLAIRSQLLLLSPLPSMGKVFSLLIQEKSQRSLTNAVHIPLDSHAMVAAQPSTQTYSNVVKFSKVKGKSDVICSHCGFSGHLVDKCF